MLMENPGNFPLDTPRLTMQPSLIKQMKKRQGLHGSLLADFRHVRRTLPAPKLTSSFDQDLVTAYGVLRKHQHALISFCKTVLAVVYPPQKVSFCCCVSHASDSSSFFFLVHCQVEKFMRGKHAFQTNKTEEQALSWFDDKVHTQVTTETRNLFTR